ncbi:MAG: diaminopimelate decarboxylase, partial [Pseudobdellovibrionaceae bacterium]
MEFLSYNNHVLSLGLKQKSLWPLAEKYTSPVYIYDLDFLADRAQKLQKAFAARKGLLSPLQVFYAMKANSNIEVLKTLKNQGCGADVVSAGEILRAKEAGIDGAQMVYSGVGKTVRELTLALENKVDQINIESLPELLRIIDIVKQRPQLGPAQVALRINPDISIETHPYITTGLKENKFGMEISLIPELVQVLKDNLPSVTLVGLSLHLGSQMLELSSFDDALLKMKAIYLDLQKSFSTLQRFDFGGGLGIFYDRSDLALEESLLQDYAKIVEKHFADMPVQLQTEPGRWLVGHAGVLLTQVQYIKKTPHKTFAIVDTGMHHLMRPSLYQSEHRILPLKTTASSLQAEYDAKE